uniref:Uncharacterized protein n=1 Tax=Anguilla anguilla TaxID=7936 RepID=A0A0E9SN65_ANGAN
MLLEQNCLFVMQLDCCYIDTAHCIVTVKQALPGNWMNLG